MKIVCLNGAVLSVWVHNDDWRNDRCHYKWEDCRFHWLEKGNYTFYLYMVLLIISWKIRKFSN